MTAKPPYRSVTPPIALNEVDTRNHWILGMRTGQPLRFIGLSLGFAWIIVALAGGPIAGDFKSFYASGASWNAGLSPYPGDPDRPNMNPPTAVVLAFAPMARLSPRAAATVWVLAGCLGIAGSLRAIRRETNLSDTDFVTLTAGLLAGFPALTIWVEGQLIWFLMYPMTRAWTAYRSGRPMQAGLWLAPVIAVKPMFAIAACLLGAATMIPAGLASTGLTAATFLWTGPRPWIDWLASGAHTVSLTTPINASLWAWLARALGGRFHDHFVMGDFGDWRIVGGVLAFIAVGAAWATRGWGSSDQRWLTAAAASVLVSPIGWAFYLVIVTGAIVALWRSSLAVRAGTWAVSLPITFLFPWRSAPTWWFASAGSLTCIGLLAFLFNTIGERCDIGSPHQRVKP